MRQVLFVILLVGWALPAAAAKIVFPNDPALHLDDHLAYFFAQMPAEQLLPDPELELVRLRGKVDLDLRAVGEPMRSELAATFESVFAGERAADGVFVDAMGATVFYYTVGRIPRVSERRFCNKLLLRTASPAESE